MGDKTIIYEREDFAGDVGLAAVCPRLAITKGNTTNRTPAHTITAGFPTLIIRVLHVLNTPRVGSQQNMQWVTQCQALTLCVKSLYFKPPNPRRQQPTEQSLARSFREQDRILGC
jgi:hypothetical protein